MDEIFTSLVQFCLINAPRHAFVAMIEMSNCTGLATVQGKTYGVCVFVRVSCEDRGSFRLRKSKCRLAPVKELSILQLELMACLLLSRLIVSMKLAGHKEISVEKIFCWMDPQIALWWIRQRCKEWKVWVLKRVETIRENVVLEHWGFVSTSLNPDSVGKLKSWPIRLAN